MLDLVFAWAATICSLDKGFALGINLI